MINPEKNTGLLVNLNREKKWRTKMKEFERWFDKEVDGGQEIYPSTLDDCKRVWNGLTAIKGMK